MIDFKNVVSPHKLNRDWILSKVSDNQIFAFYFGIFKIGPAYKSKLRRDKVPSVGFFIGKSGELVYNDFASKENFNCFQYVMRLFGYRYNDALRRIIKDFGLDGEQGKVTAEFLEATKEFDRDAESLKFIQVITKKWDADALKYWSYYEITKEELIANDVVNVDLAFVQKENTGRDSKVEIPPTKDFPRFAYGQTYVSEEGADMVGVKLYNPMDSDHKWINSIPIYIPFGLEKLKYESETVFVTKSQKDRIILLKIFPDVIATQNESEEAFPLELQQHLEKYFKRIVIVYGADDQGVEACKKFNARGCEYFNTPREAYDRWGIEDPADYVKFYGLDLFKELLKDKKLL